MPEFFLELFSEEIPAGMQGIAISELFGICSEVLSQLSWRDARGFTGPRRLAIKATIDNEKPGTAVEARGPREGAPEAAIQGFLNKHAACYEDLKTKNGHYLLSKTTMPASAREVIEKELSAALSKFRWRKSMRWGGSGDITWIRPLRRAICLLDGKVIPIKLGPIIASDITEGHRVLAPGTFAVSSAAQWAELLCDHFVMVDSIERQRKIEKGLNEIALSLGLSVVADDNLLTEVVGLVEWPVVLAGKIDDEFMDLPPEVRELSMKVNQKYFALRDAYGHPAPYFAFVANLEAPDAGAAIVAGNERVLRARLSDARYFWNLDLQIPLTDLLPQLELIVFHAKLGTQRERSERVALLARKISKSLGANEATAEQAEWAGRLCKADLVTGMVGEFPELQGIMGGYYAKYNPRGWDGNKVGAAIKTHYQPRGLAELVPKSVDKISEAVALADKLDTLVQFFNIGEKPTGSGDPYALRRAALGVIRIILENDLSEIDLRVFCLDDDDLFNFILERLRVKLKTEGRRFDVLDAVFAVSGDGNLVKLMKRVNALTGFLLTAEGKDLVAAYRRAANILRIEDAVDGPHTSKPVLGPLPCAEEEELRDMLAHVQRESVDDFRESRFAPAMAALAKLRSTIDLFFDKVTVNAPEVNLRRNRLALLARFRDTVHQIADFSKLEG
jgi:glycyl-tRNA synthetase beta chain